MSGPTWIEPTKGPCGKRTYANEAIGRKLARRINEAGKERVHPYHCTRCHGWHLGTPNGHLRTKRPKARLELP